MTLKVYQMFTLKTQIKVNEQHICISQSKIKVKAMVCHWHCHWQTLSHKVISSTPHHERDSNSQTLLVMGTDCIVTWKSNYHTITTPSQSRLESSTISITYKRAKFCIFIRKIDINIWQHEFKTFYLNYTVNK